MDDVDRAQVITDAHLSDALARQRASASMAGAASFCRVCDSDIPLARQRAVRTSLCIACAEAAER